MDDTQSTINWGDGVNLWPITQGADTLTATHTYVDNNAPGTLYAVHISYYEGDGLFEADTTATIYDVAPTLSNLNATAINENGVTRLTGTITDPGVLDNFWLDINWGDPRSPGNAEDNITYGVSATGSQTFSLTHHYLDNPTGSPSGQYTTAMDVTDQDGETGFGSTTVTVSNLAPIVGWLTVTTSLEGALSNVPALLSGTFSEPGSLDSHTVIFNWGDGTMPTTLPSLPAGTLDFSGITHTYADNRTGGPPGGGAFGNYTISVTVKDNDNITSLPRTVIATVGNVPPSLSNVVVTASSEGGSAMLSGIIFDPSPLDSTTLKIAWGGGAILNETFNFVPPNNALLQTSFSVPHSYPDNGAYPVLVKVKDDDMSPDVLWPSVTVTGAMSAT